MTPNSIPGSWTKKYLFPEKYTRKLYWKKIPEITEILSKCPDPKFSVSHEHRKKCQRQNIPQEETGITGPEPTEEQDGCIIEGETLLMAGIEVHAHIRQEDGRPRIIFTYLPTVHDREIPEDILEINMILETICRKTITLFSCTLDITRFYFAAKKDGENSRCWYRIKINAGIGANDREEFRISDTIDPDFVQADPHVVHRAKKARAMIIRALKGIP
jgi:hypothetical protein